MEGQRQVYKEVFYYNIDVSNICMVYFKDLNLLDIDSSNVFILEYYYDSTTNTSGYKER